MKKYLILIILSLTITITLSSCSFSKSVMVLTSEQRQSDFMFLYDLLEREYPLFDVKYRQHGVTWLENKEEYKERINQTNNDVEFFNELNTIINELQDSHTNLVSPISFKQYNKISPDVLKHYPDKEKEFIYDVISSAEKEYEYWEKTLSDSLNETKNDSIRNSSSESKVSFNRYHDDKTVYVKVRSFSLSNEERESIFNFLQQNNACSNIIIDITDNVGGSDFTWLNYIVLPLLNDICEVDKISAFRGGSLGEQYIDTAINDNVSYVKISKKNITDLPEAPHYPEELTSDFKYYTLANYSFHPVNTLSFKGNIFVLINNKVFSAAEGFAAFCKATNFATLVGENTKGDGGSFSPILVKLPNSGLIVRMRLQMTLNPDGSASAEYGTTPDIEVDAEKALETTLKIIEKKKN